MLMSAFRHRVRLLEEVKEVLRVLVSEFGELKKISKVLLEYKVDEKGSLMRTFHCWVVDRHGYGKCANCLAENPSDGSLERFDFQFNALNDLSLR